MSALTLRPYQVEVVEEIRGLLRTGARRVMLYSPTGSGKTEIGIDFTRRARERSKRVLFVANRVELVAQAWCRFHRSGIEAGVLQANNTRGLDRPVQIASIHTLAKRGCPDFDLLLIDEAHAVAGSKAYIDLVKTHPDKPVIGLSATPFARGLGRDIQGIGLLFEHLAVATTIRDLIDLGFLVDVDIYGPSEPDLSNVKIVAGDYQEEQLARAVDQPQLVGDIVSHWHRLAGGKPTVCFATSIAHSKHIVEQFHATGVTAEHIDCYTTDDDRRAVLERFEQGETRVISNVGVLSEGWDCPVCEVMILARPTKSLTRYIQMAGRILRPHEGKIRGLILDHSGTVRRLGFPTDDLPLELDVGSRRRRSPERVKESLPEQCPSCAYLMPPRTRICPACGFEPKRLVDMHEQEGDLVPLHRGKIASADKTQVFRELLGFAEQKGYRPGWAAYKMHELFGTWPERKQSVEPVEPSSDTIRLVRYLNIRNAKSREAHAA